MLREVSWTEKCNSDVIEVPEVEERRLAGKSRYSK
jgi:hypothetical protein